MIQGLLLFSGTAGSGGSPVVVSAPLIATAGGGATVAQLDRAGSIATAADAGLVAQASNESLRAVIGGGALIAEVQS